MAKSTSAHIQCLELSRLGFTAFNAGDAAAARAHFLRAVELERREAGHRYNLAVALEALGDYDGAAKQLTVGLKLNPKMLECARQLSVVLRRAALSDKADLDADGLAAALEFPAVDKEMIAQCALRYLLAREPLRTLLRKGASDGWDAIARDQCLKATGAILRHPLFLSILRASINTHHQLEHFLTALRRIIVTELPVQRLADPAILTLVVALARQCHVNEFVWAVTPAEKKTLDGWALSIAGAPASVDPSTARALMLSGLYRSYHEVVRDRAIDNLFGKSGVMRCEALGAFMATVVAERLDERARADRFAREVMNSDPTSRIVADQYEANPYPRWTSLGMRVRPEEIRNVLGVYFPDTKLKFMDANFDVLIAGCGTGRQAIAAAITYGSRARVVALDLSAASLSYAARMAEEFGVTNIEFVRGDILDVGQANDMRHRFKIIECCGVLHHMADPWAGWRSLLKGLDRDGVMHIALYSSMARSELTALRDEDRYPGPGCDDDALRSYRQELLERSALKLDQRLIGSPDFYTTSGFRDLTLHVSEKCVTLPEIGQFMKDNSLVFRGFNDRGHFGALRAKYAGQVWPGDWQRWVEFEASTPSAFAGMYQFWCDVHPK